MARQLRIQYSGAVYHVMNRGYRREPVFVELSKGQPAGERAFGQFGLERGGLGSTA